MLGCLQNHLENRNLIDILMNNKSIQIRSMERNSKLLYRFAKHLVRYNLTNMIVA